MFTQTSEFEAAFGVQSPVRADLVRASDAGHIEAPSRTIAETSRQTFAGIVAAFSRWRKVRQTSRILSTLDERMLNDIGLTRSEFGAYGAADDILRRTIQRWR